MKIILITDTHLGIRNNSSIFMKYQLDRWKDLFKYAKHFGIKTVIHGGDFFDNRSSIGLSVLHATQEFNRLLKASGVDFHLLVGNHDVAFKNDNALNSPDLLLEGVNVYWDAPRTLSFDGVDIDLIPWVNNSNYASVKSFIGASTSSICIGHFEINGAPFHKGGIPCEDGIDAALFKAYDLVLSGHFHTRSRVGNVHYFGAAFDYTWADWNDQRGFIVLDTETKEFQTIDWKSVMFVMGEMDEEGNTTLYPEVETIKDKYVKIAVSCKTNKKVEAAIKKLEEQDPAEFQVFFELEKDVNTDTVDLKELNDETAVMRKVVEESIPDQELRVQINSYLAELHREASLV